MILNLTSSITRLILFVFVLYLTQGLIFLIQALVFGEVMLGPKIIKYILFLILLIALLMKVQVTRKITFTAILTLILYSLFLCFNFFMIQISDDGGQPLKAFIYNYSLSIVLIPLGVLYLNNEAPINLVTKKSRFWLVTIFIAISIFAAYEIVVQKSVFNIYYEILSVNEVIKFDQIGGFLRASSIFKSPIDYSYINAIFSSLFLVLFLKYKAYGYLLLVITMSMIEVAVFVRSGLVFMMVSYFVITFSYYSLSRFIAYLFIAIPLFLGAFAYIYLNFNVIFDPSNFINRINGWGKLIYSIHTVPELLFGKGIVQNGSFGLRHALVIDNLYVGILYSGGLVSIIIFFIIIIIILFGLKFCSKTDGISQWRLGVFLGMLAAGMFENVMHLFYLGLIPLFFELTITKTAPLNFKNRPKTPDQLL